MNKKRLILLTGLILVSAITVILANHKVINAQECRIIRIYGGETLQIKELHLEPETIWITKGTCLIWVNWVRTEEIKIIFAEGKKCQDVTEVPSEWKIDAANCYVTSYIPLGGTSSLRFIEEGTFEYLVEVKGKPENKIKGRIVVR